MKKEQIIQTSRKLFHQFGFKKVSMDEIAKEAGVTKKTIYTYFSSKEELLEYFIVEEIENMKEIIEEVEKKHLSFFEKINEAIYKLLKYRKDREFLNIIAREAEFLKNPILINNMKLVDQQIKDYIKQKLILAKEKGYIQYQDLEITTFLIYKMYIALIVEQMIANSISEILEKGLRKEVL